jgi:AcrR family transcriptional regulator
MFLLRVTHNCNDAILLYQVARNPLVASPGSLSISCAVIMSKESLPDVRERILDAAVHVLEENPGKFTMNRVASEAGVSRATVYRRFGSAEGLREALRDDRGSEAACACVGIRARVLDAALTEFSRAGVHGATIHAIAARAGVSPMTVYNHFDDKEGLVFALITGRGPGRLLSQSREPDDAFESLIAKFVAGVMDITQSQRDLFGLIFAPDPITRKAFQRMRGTANDPGSALAEVFERKGLPDGLDPRVAAASLMGMIIANGVLRPMLFGDEVADPDVLTEQITKLFLKAVS